ncbi:MAG: helicase-related protein [Gemmatimonadales bacterium]
MTAVRPDPGQVMAKLRDFQRATAEYAFRRMYLDEDHTTRFLVADEVGLGKTMVAKGVIAKAIDHLWDQTDRIDIVYICSNSAIARQNINRLNVTREQHHAIASRITMLPIDVRDLNSRKLNFVSLTPATSFDPRSSMGMWRERVLLYHMLESPWQLKGAAPLNVLQGDAGTDRFRQKVDWFRADQIDIKVAESFAQALVGQPDLRAAFEEACQYFGRAGARSKRPERARELQRNVIGRLRSLLAQTCLKALEPDLIILDEFQRFKHLLDAEDEEAELAHELFNYADSNEAKARVLLLSATPYRMFTQADEGEVGDGQDHYQDFAATLGFLQHDESRTAATKELLGQYRREWLRLGGHSDERLLELKNLLEAELRRVIVRTERLAATPDRDGMLVAKPIPGLAVEPREALAFRAIGRLADLVEHGDPIEYWKGAPYLLSFMETRQYQLKHDIDEAASDPDLAGQVSALVESRLPLVLPWESMTRYERIDPGNARMRWLVERTVGSGAWRLLWVRPSRPWYRLGGAFGDPGLADFTKTLVFSGWQVVPKAIAGVVSYAAEREMMVAGGHTENTAEARKAVSRPLRFAQAGGASLFTLVYPSPALAQVALDVRAALPAGATMEQALDAAERRIRDLLEALPTPETGGRADEDWYWAAPALLDAAEGHCLADKWFGRENLIADWLAGGDDEDVAGEGTEAEQFNMQHLRLHVRQEGSRLGSRPADLSRVLAEVALGSPAVSGLAAMSTVLGESCRWNDQVRVVAGQVGWAFRAYFNLPEVSLMLRGGGAALPYWQAVLQYGVAGGIAAVMEEYVHILRESLGVVDQPAEEAAAAIADEIAAALGLRTASMRVDEAVEQQPGRVKFVRRGLRSRYAVRLVGDEEKDEEGTAGKAGGGRRRMDAVRAAFNSPFWPFVLATTSIGQEGLDFHGYCHAVVHWNLPSNPVDLEQREGRVHRYKGHAVRKNVARQHAGVPPVGDPWAELFSSAVAARADGSSDIVPFWVYPAEGGAKIERYLPALPLSRDIVRYEALRRTAAMYRAVIGQSRQEDLLEIVNAAGADPGTIEKFAIDLGPPTARRGSRRDG